MTARWKWIGIGAGALGIAGVLSVALFPWGMLRDRIERGASERFGRQVTIGDIDRIDTIGFHPLIAIRDIRVPQARWAGAGDLARIHDIRVRFSVWPLLRGRFEPQDIHVTGARLTLVRAADGRTNWSRPGEDAGGGASNPLRGLTIADTVIAYRDAKQDRRFVVRLSADPANGVRATGEGMVRGAAVTLAASGPAIAQAGKPWPFDVRIDGQRLAMTARGVMDAPLDTRAMTLDMTARADDLKLIDAVIEAGLFRTRAVNIRAHIRHDAPRWTITGLTGTIGRSDLTGRLSVDKVAGRTKLDGTIASRQLDFDDLSSPEGRAQAAALERRIGPRLVPNTQVDIGKIDTTDGRIAFRIGRVVSAQGPSPIVAASGVMRLDDRILTVSPVTLRLTQGVVTGRAIVDQRGGRHAPVVTLDLQLRDANVVTLAGGGGDFTGRISARARLTGRGETIRAAIGRADGSVGFVVRDGELPERYAAALGFDAGRALLARDGERAGLRCLVLRLAVKGGQGRVDPLVIDTTESQTRGTGFVRFPDETLALRLTGAPKHGSILRLPGSVTMTGTIQQPDLNVPPQIKSVGNIFKAIGRAIAGTSGPEAQDADCATLSARALG